MARDAPSNGLDETSSAAGPRPNELQHHAADLVEAGRDAEAARALEALVRMTAGSPESYWHHLNLASTYANLEWFASATHHFNHVLEHSPLEDVKEDCRWRLRLVANRRAVARGDAELRRLQLQRSVERIEGGRDELLELERLGRTVLMLGETTPGHPQLAHVRELLKRALEEHPESPDVLHGLLHCCIALGDAAEQERLLRSLEDVEPESAQLAGLADRLAAGLPALPVPPSVRAAWGLVDRLGDRAPADPQMREAFLEDLRAFAERYPTDVDCCTAYAFGLMNEGRTQELEDYLPHVATLERPEHTFHYNYAQLLRAAGDPASGRHHMELSLHLATTPEDEADARELLDRWAAT
jgi:hypothetical protein